MWPRYAPSPPPDRKLCEKADKFRFMWDYVISAIRGRGGNNTDIGAMVLEANLAWRKIKELV